MENDKNSDDTSLTNIGSGYIFGTSSEDIVKGLHSGQFVETESGAAEGIENNGDKDQIVNQQEQNEIVNPVKNDYEEDKTETTASEGTISGGTDKTAATEFVSEESAVEGDDLEDLEKSTKTETPIKQDRKEQE